MAVTVKEIGTPVALASGASITLNTPATAAVGDYLVAVLWCQNASATDWAMGGTGFARLGPAFVPNDTTGARTGGMFGQYLTAAPAASYTWTTPVASAARYVGVIIALSSVDAATPIDSSSPWATGTSTTSLPVPAVGTTGGDYTLEVYDADFASPNSYAITTYDGGLATLIDLASPAGAENTAVSRTFVRVFGGVAPAGGVPAHTITTAGASSHRAAYLVSFRAAASPSVAGAAALTTAAGFTAGGTVVPVAAAALTTGAAVTAPPARTVPAVAALTTPAAVAVATAPTTQAAAALTTGTALAGTASSGPAAAAALTTPTVLTGPGIVERPGVAALTTGVALTGKVTPRPGYATVTEMLAQATFYAAHRGGSRDYPEMSLYAYEQAALRGYPALELSLARTSDGVWFGLHDASLDRTSLGTGGGSGTTLVASSMTWAQVQQYQILGSTAANNTGQPNRPYMRWEEIVAEFYPSHILFVDPKAALGFISELIAMMNALPGRPQDHLVGKYYGVAFGATESTTGWSYICRANGYKTWGYFYEADSANYTTYAPRWDILGQDYGATQAAWDALKAAAPGKPVMGHIVPDAASASTALTKGAAGLMVSGVVPVVPAVVQQQLTAALGTGVGLTAGPGRAVTAAAALTNVPSLTAAAAVTPPTAAAAALTTGTALTGTGSVAALTPAAVAFTTPVGLGAGASTGTTTGAALATGSALTGALPDVARAVAALTTLPAAGAAPSSAAVTALTTAPGLTAVNGGGPAAPLTTAPALTGPGKVSSPAAAAALATGTALAGVSPPSTPVAAALTTAPGVTAAPGTVPAAGAVLTTPTGLTAVGPPPAVGGAAALTSAPAVTVDPSSPPGARAVTAPALTAGPVVTPATPAVAALTTGAAVTAAVVAARAATAALTSGPTLTGVGAADRPAAAALASVPALGGPAARELPAVAWLASLAVLAAASTTATGGAAVLTSAPTLTGAGYGTAVGVAALTTTAQVAPSARVLPLAAGYGRVRLTRPAGQIRRVSDLPRGVYTVG